MLLKKYFAQHINIKLSFQSIDVMQISHEKYCCLFPSTYCININKMLNSFAHKYEAKILQRELSSKTLDCIRKSTFQFNIFSFSFSSSLFPECNTMLLLLSYWSVTPLNFLHSTLKLSTITSGSPGLPLLFFKSSSPPSTVGTPLSLHLSRLLGRKPERRRKRTKFFRRIQFRFAKIGLISHTRTCMNLAIKIASKHWTSICGLPCGRRIPTR